jgi:hypothetical protein
MAILRSSHKADKPKAQTKSAFYLSPWTAANKTESRFCQKVYDESNYFTSPDPVDVYRNHLHYEVVRSFLEWSCQISGFTTSISLFTYAKAWRMGVEHLVASTTLGSEQVPSFLFDFFPRLFLACSQG